MNCRRALQCRFRCLLVGLILTGVAGQLRADGETVELVRDQWGVPHVFARTDAGAMYGLGYATAEDRGFQMVYNLRVIQGRLAEVIGDVRKTRRKESAVGGDRKMRMFGFYPAATRVAGNLDPETKQLLTAYCDGVNAYFAQHRTDRHYLFDKLHLEPEPWTPADCIVSWWHIAQFFGPDGTRDLNASRGGPRGRLPGRGGRAGRGGPPARRPARQPVRSVAAARGDEAAAVVRREDVSDAWIAKVDRFLAEHGLAEQPGHRPGTDAKRWSIGRGGVEGPKFSHAWVVGGKKTSTGSAVLVSDPQTMVGNPSMFYEFHVQGKTFNARGVGVPGSPVILIGFTDKVAWGMTALGADQADLFRLKTDREHPDQYFFDGQWHEMTVSEETIRVKGGPSQTVRVRWTRFGPVITDYVFARQSAVGTPGEGEFAVKRVPICQGGRETIQGALAMMRAGDVYQFGRALAGWSFPSANVVFGDRQGNIGYWVLGAFPVRSAHAAEAGRFPHDGTESKYDWQGIVPHDLKPHLINPKRGYVFSANHRPVGSFYNLYLGATTGSLGDTLRSLRLRELIVGKERFTPEEVLAVHYTSVNPARRDIARIGYHLRDVLKQRLSPGATNALEHLEGWYQAGCPSDLNIAGAELAVEINTFFRIVRTELAGEYGGGESGLSLFLKDIHARLAENPQAAIRPREIEFVDHALSSAWQAAQSRYGPDPKKWPEQAHAAVGRRKLGYYESLDGFPSLDAAQDLDMPAITCIDGATIRSQAAQAYTQFVPLHDVDRALSLLPVGQSERPQSRFRTSTLDLWVNGKLHPAPLSRAAVQKHAAGRQLLTRSASSN